MDSRGLSYSTLTAQSEIEVRFFDRGPFQLVGNLCPGTDQKVFFGNGCVVRILGTATHGFNPVWWQNPLPLDAYNASVRLSVCVFISMS